MERTSMFAVSSAAHRIQYSLGRTQEAVANLSGRVDRLCHGAGIGSSDMSDATAATCATIDRVVAGPTQDTSSVAHDRPAVRDGKESGALRRCRFLTPIHYFSGPGRSGVLWALHQAVIATAPIFSFGPWTKCTKHLRRIRSQAAVRASSLDPKPRVTASRFSCRSK